MKGRIWHPNLHMNTPLYLQFHVVLCNLLLNHHVNITTMNILVVEVPTALPKRAAHNGECYMKSSSSTFALVEKIVHLTEENNKIIWEQNFCQLKNLSISKSNHAWSSEIY